MDDNRRNVIGTPAIIEWGEPTQRIDGLVGATPVGGGGLGGVGAGGGGGVGAIGAAGLATASFPTGGIANT